MPQPSMQKTKSSKGGPTLLRGFRDILPEESRLWERLHRKASELFSDYDYSLIETPILESTSLFRRSIGANTDIVEKEMFTFTDRSRESVTLRPEMTAGIARAYIEHGMFNRPQPVKLYSSGPLFRYDRPQAGRFREFHQIDFEIFGNDGPSADAEIMFLSYLLCAQFDLPVVIQVNSLGDADERDEYVQALKEYFRPKRRLLNDDDKKRLTKNPLRLLDSKDPQCRELVQDAPQLVDYLREDSKQHFVKVLEHLDEAEVPYTLDPFIVRGLDYYNRTAFEVVLAYEKDDPDAFIHGVPNALGGGGRYDHLIEQLGGRGTPAVGMAFGVERLIEAIKEKGTPEVPANAPEVFLAQLGEEATKRAFLLFEQLRKKGFKVRANFSKDGLKQQLELAHKLGVVYTIILGQKELLDGTIIIRDMENGIQEVVDLKKIPEELAKRLQKIRSLPVD